MKKAISLLAAVTLALGIFMPLNAQSDKAVTLPKQVINGDAENSIYGWRGLFGDGTTVISNVELDGNRVIKVEPKSHYGSPMFDIGPAIINDDSMKDSADYYAGGGAGKYTVSFRFKPETELSGDMYFMPSICSAEWNAITVSNANDWAIMKAGSDWTTITKTFTVTQEHLDKLKTLYDSGNTDAYFMYCRIDGSDNKAFNSGNNLFSYYIDDFTITKEGASVKHNAREVVNGNAELGTLEGWNAMNGAVENVDDNGNRVIKLTPTDDFGTVQFDIGPAIINDDSMKDSADYFVGGGAGTYTVSFRFKPETELSGDKYFSPSICSKVWNAINISTANDWAIMKAGSDWTTITKTFTVTEDNIAALKALYDGGNTDAYFMYLRLDGSGNKAFADGTFAYYIDNFKIEKVDATVKFNSFSVDIANDFTFNYKVKNFPDGASVTFAIDGNQIGETLYSGTKDEDGAIVFSLKNITPLWASKKVVVTLAVNGNAVDEKSYSLEDYCVEMLNTTDDYKLRRLLSDLLCYCRATQDYAEETENLTDSAAWVNRGYATLNEVDYTRASEKAIISDCENKTASWKSAALVLKNNVAVRFRFTAESAENLKAVVNVNGKDTTVTDIKSDGNAYYIDFNDLYVSQFLDKMTVKIYSGDTQISNTLTYSVYSYAKSKHGDSNDKLGKLVDSIMNYGLSAQAYNK